ncbi:hypothetical protein INR49_010805 [Caranx melampygus]|nr:hypothetical protein INR49_010805 [Caranx melampygus]
MPLAKDLLHPTIDHERRQHKKKRLVQSPNSYFMDVKCPGLQINTVSLKVATRLPLCSAMHRLWYSVWMLNCAVSAKRRKGQADRGLLFQEEATLKRDFTFDVYDLKPYC